MRQSFRGNWSSSSIITLAVCATRRLRHAETAELKVELNDIAAELASAPRVLCHRDYHASNLMIDGKRDLRVIDHQDARMGPGKL
jgi:aminoglycoside/choline kinase family phosphotransferase